MLTIAYVANAVNGGIDAFELNLNNGSLVKSGTTFRDQGVAPLAVSPDRRFLYAGLKSPAGIAAFAIDSDNGTLHHLNSIESPSPLHYLTVDAKGRFLLAASYGGNFIGVHALGKDGMAQSEAACFLRPGRNPHCILLDASNQFAYVPVLGSDIVAMYRFNQDTGELTPKIPPFVAAPREAGPRHLAFSPDNRFAYVLMEMGGEVTSYSVGKADGSLTQLQTVPVLPAENTLPKGSYTPPVNSTGGGNSPFPVMWTAEIRITPDNRFLYASERTGSTLTCFRIDPISGRLDLQHVVKTEEQPRSFCIDPFGRHLLAVGEKSDHVSVYSIDRESGALTLTDREPVGSGPIWVETVRLR